VRVSDFFTAGADADAAITRIEQQIAAAQQQAERAQQFQAEIDGVRGVARSPRREVQVTVDAAGRLAGVELSDAAMELAPRALAQLLVETANAAQRDAGAKAVDIAAAAFGQESGVVDRLRAEVDKEPPSATSSIRE
jgi:DNA-binding protein YbaB